MSLTIWIVVSMVVSAFLGSAVGALIVDADYRREYAKHKELFDCQPRWVQVIHEMDLTEAKRRFPLKNTETR